MQTRVFLRVELDHELYALRADLVREVFQAVAPSTFPGAPPVVQGILNVRGELVPLVDFRSKLGLPARTLRASDHVVVGTCRGRTIAFVVDRAIDVVDLDPQSITAAGTLVRGATHVAGLARSTEGILVITDIAALLGADEELLLGTALAGLPA